MKKRDLIALGARVPQRPGHVSRRRCLALFASAAVLPLTAKAASTPTRTWHGSAMGGDVSITLQGFSSSESAELKNLALTELDRLEDLFSLFRPTSALSKLNADGACTDAPDELIAALNFCRELYDTSTGAFDPSIQRVWECHEAGRSDLSSALRLVGFDRVRISNREIALPVGMALTLNGIAQGIATDRVATLLRDAGARHTLINLGEFRALGPKADGSAWRIGLRNPAAIWRVDDVVALRAGALATSAGSGYKFRNGHHLLDPESGQSAEHFSSVSVIAPSATLADGLSTALYVLPLSRAKQMVSQYHHVAARFTYPDGKIITTDRWDDLVA